MCIALAQFNSYYKKEYHVRAYQEKKHSHKYLPTTLCCRNEGGAQKDNISQINNSK